MDQTIISVSGYGATGSSAIVDLLREFPSTQVSDFEFTLLYLPDGISDLDYKLNNSCNRFYDSDVAFSRFLELCEKLDAWYDSSFHGQLFPMACQYIDALTQCKWNGFWFWDRLQYPVDWIQQIDDINEHIYKKNENKRRVNRILRRLHLPLIKMKPRNSYYALRPMRMSICPSNFLIETQRFLDALIGLANAQGCRFVIFDQMTPPLNPQRYHKYFSIEIKSISVNRDPRDLYIHAKLRNDAFTAHDSADSFIAWYLENNQPQLKNEDKNVLYLQFEDLIYQYEETVKAIQQFIGISDSPTKEHFNPSISAVNTQIFLRHPEFSDDIKLISERLKPFLYNFEEHQHFNIPQNADIF